MIGIKTLLKVHNLVIFAFRGEELWVAIGFSNAQMPLVAVRLGLVASSVHFPWWSLPNGHGRRSKGDGLIWLFYTESYFLRDRGLIGPRGQFLAKLGRYGFWAVRMAANVT